MILQIHFECRNRTDSTETERQVTVYFEFWKWKRHAFWPMIGRGAGGSGVSLQLMHHPEMALEQTQKCATPICLPDLIVFCCYPKQPRRNDQGSPSNRITQLHFLNIKINIILQISKNKRTLMWWSLYAETSKYCRLNDRRSRLSDTERVSWVGMRRTFRSTSIW